MKDFKEIEFLTPFKEFQDSYIRVLKLLEVFYLHSELADLTLRWLVGLGVEWKLKWITSILKLFKDY